MSEQEERQLFWDEQKMRWLGKIARHNYNLEYMLGESVQQVVGASEGALFGNDLEAAQYLSELYKFWASIFDVVLERKEKP